jgi:uncharacterized protein YutE (UPF0331/DUF86 family)
LIDRKLALMLGYNDELAALVTGSRATSGPGNVERRAIERLVQLLVEAATDVNGIVTASSGARPPATARESFVAVRDLGVLPKPLAERFIASYVGLRNRVVHDYETLEHRLVVEAGRRLVTDTTEYARCLRKFAQAGEGEDVKTPP